MEWISVKERLPKNTNDVLVVIKDKTIFMARYYDNGYWKFYFSDAGLAKGEQIRIQPTHWMPLPKLPKQ